MSKPKVLGKFVYIDIPEKQETKIQVDENTKEALQKEWISKLSRLKVWAVGESANPSIKEGDMVLIDPNSINSIKMVPMDDGSVKGLILDYHIVHIWP
jgi:hypothetical protein